MVAQIIEPFKFILTEHKQKNILKYLNHQTGERMDSMSHLMFQL